MYYQFTVAHICAFKVLIATLNSEHSIADIYACYKLFISNIIPRRVIAQFCIRFKFRHACIFHFADIDQNVICWKKNRVLCWLKTMSFNLSNRIHCIWKQVTHYLFANFNLFFRLNSKNQSFALGMTTIFRCTFFRVVNNNMTTKLYDAWLKYGVCLVLSNKFPRTMYVRTCN